MKSQIHGTGRGLTEVTSQLHTKCQAELLAKLLMSLEEQELQPMGPS